MPTIFVIPIFPNLSDCLYLQKVCDFIQIYTIIPIIVRFERFFQPHRSKSLVGSGFILIFADEIGAGRGCVVPPVFPLSVSTPKKRGYPMSVKESRIIELPKVSDPRGNLSFIEQFRHIPFEIRRVYWIYDVPGGFDRGEHAYKENQELIVALSGSFDVVLDDGTEKVVYPLNRSYKGLYVPKGMWRRMTNFSTNSLALVLASTDYDEDDYIMDYQEFKEWRAEYEKCI